MYVETHELRWIPTPCRHCQQIRRRAVVWWTGSPCAAYALHTSTFAFLQRASDVVLRSTEVCCSNTCKAGKMLQKDRSPAKVQSILTCFSTNLISSFGPPSWSKNKLNSCRVCKRRLRSQEGGEEPPQTSRGWWLLAGILHVECCLLFVRTRREFSYHLCVALQGSRRELAELRLS